MTDIFDERRRGLEEEYFRRRDKESLDRLRAALNEQSSNEGPVTMACPRCDGRLHQKTFDDVTIDQCDRCHGVWLDAGELEQLVSRESPSNRWLKVFWPGRATE